MNNKNKKSESFVLFCFVLFCFVLFCLVPLAVFVCSEGDEEERMLLLLCY